jgi:hypothetical protein
MGTLETFLNTYGIWVGLLTYVLVKDILPFTFNKFIPGRIQSTEDQRKDRLIELTSEREWQHKLEENRVAILADISKAIQGLALGMVETNTNIVTILSNQTRILDNLEDIKPTILMKGVKK